jgi:hypothetical protein
VYEGFGPRYEGFGPRKTKSPVRALGRAWWVHARAQMCVYEDSKLAGPVQEDARRRRSQSPFRNHRRAESSLQTETHPDRSAHVREGERTGRNAASPHELQARERLGKAARRHTITLPSPFRSVILKAVTRSSPDLSTCSSWRALESPSMLIAAAGPVLSISCISWLSILFWVSSASRGSSNALQCMALDIECK